MRSFEEIKRLILSKAKLDERIRAVLLNGSRANDKIEPDKYQDFDIVYLVDELEGFISEHDWTNIFGEKLLWQLPTEMILGDEEPTDSFTYLMVFKENRNYPSNKAYFDYIHQF